MTGGTIVAVLPDSGERYLSTQLFSVKEKVALRVFNTMSRRKETFDPIQPGKVAMYSCGPTAHARMHVGECRRFVFADMLVMIVAIIANIFLQMPFLSLAISAGVILLMSAYILFQTSQMVNGGETNYIMATVSLYISIYNLFLSLLHLLKKLQLNSRVEAAVWYLKNQ